MRRARINGASALVWEAGKGLPWLHFGHATGMHAALYARLLDPLADRFNMVASDARGHGETPAGGDMAWDVLGRDTLALMEVVAPGQAVWLAGHSMGATSALLAAVMAPERVLGVVMLDPPFIPFDVARAAGGVPVPNPLADQAEKRRAVFASRDEALASYAGRGVFRQFSEQDLAAYVAGGFVDDGDGVRLACVPGVEAAAYRGVRLDVEQQLARLVRPFVMLAAESGSTVGEGEFAAFAGHPQCVRAERVTGTGHFLPLQAPDVVRAAIRGLCV